MDKPTRTRIVEAADDLFYRCGFEHTSFSDIAAAVGLSRGNFYYHFKTKDEILEAVIDLRMKRSEDMLARWQEEGQTPKGRIACFINILIANIAKIKHYGCPLGTLSSELAKLDHDSKGRAGDLFTLFRGWLKGQFDALGCGERSDVLAMHVLARSQGIATLASAFRDESFIHQEVKLLEQWLDNIARDCEKVEV